MFECLVSLFHDLIDRHHHQHQFFDHERSHQLLEITYLNIMKI